MGRTHAASDSARVQAFPRSGTVLAFDFGTKRVGVAVGDAALGTAHPLPGLHAADGAARLAAVARLVAEWGPSALVVGLPLDVNGAPQASTLRAQRFARQLEARFRLPVARVDERYSSVAADSRMREAGGALRAARAVRKQTLDSYAAQLLLEQYFAEVLR